MLAIVAGLGAALAWAVSVLAATRSSRQIGAASTVAWVMLVGLPIAILAVLPSASALTSAALPWLVVAGVGNVVGLGLEYTGLRTGRIGIVAPLASTEGAIAALISVAAGQPITGGLVLALAVVTLGVGLTAAAPVPHAGNGQGTARGRALLAVAMGLGAALAFGASLYATGRVSQALPLAWVLLPPRVAGVVLVALPLLARGRLRIERRVAPLVIVAGLAEVVGFLCIGLGARSNVAVTAVLASQFAAFAVLGAVLLFGERLQRIQWTGIVAIAVGTAFVAGLQV